MVSAISNRGLARFRFIDTAMNADVLVAFMGQLVADSSQKVFLILNNLKAHHAKAVTRRVGEHHEQIEVFHLPPHTPEHDPAKYLNRDFKIQLRSSTRSATLDASRQKAEAFLQFLLNTPARVMAYFSHYAAHYAAQSPVSLPG